MNTPTLALGGLCAGLLFGSGYWLGHHDKNGPESVQQAHTQTLAIHDTVAKTDTLVLKSVKKLVQVDTQYQHSRDTVLIHLTDTVKVKEFVQACDSLASSCESYRKAAQAKFHADSLLFQTQAHEVEAWRSQQPSKLRRITSFVVVGLAGFGLGRAGGFIPLH